MIRDMPPVLHIVDAATRPSMLAQLGELVCLGAAGGTLVQVRLEFTRTGVVEKVLAVGNPLVLAFGAVHGWTSRLDGWRSSEASDCRRMA